MRFYTTFVLAALIAIQGEAVKISSMVHKSADHADMEDYTIEDVEACWDDAEACWDDLSVEE